MIRRRSIRRENNRLMLCRATTTTQSSSSSSRWIYIRTSRSDMFARASMLHGSSKCVRERRAVIIRFARRTSRVRPDNVSLTSRKQNGERGWCMECVNASIFTQSHLTWLSSLININGLVRVVFFCRLSQSANKSTSPQPSSAERASQEQRTPVKIGFQT